MIKTALVWFKTDLRLEDNETLVRAISQSQEIIPDILLLTIHILKLHVYGFKKTGSFRALFLIESLTRFGYEFKKNRFWITHP